MALVNFGHMTKTNRDYPRATTDLTEAKAQLDEFGCCILKNALSQDEVSALRRRLLEQTEAEAQQGRTHINDDKKQLLLFLLNKGKDFRELLFHPEVLKEASQELLALIGFKPWCGYGHVESRKNEWVTRGQYALGELRPD